MRTVYACVFDVAVAAAESPAQGLERLWALAAQWVEELYRQDWQAPCTVTHDGIATAPRPKHALKGTREQTGVCELISLDWSYPDRLDEGLRWVIALNLARNGKRLEVSLAVRILSTQPIVKPLTYAVERPALIDRILTGFSCFVGKTPIPLRPRELDREAIPFFVEDALCAADRWLPIVLISAEQSTHDYLLDPAELQRGLLGHAMVATLRDHQAGFALTDCLGRKELSCYLGAVRVYWPGFHRAAKPDEHPLYLADSIRWHADNKQPLGQHLFRMLVGVSGFRFSNAPTARLVRDFLDQEKQARFQHLVANSKSADEVHAILQELERAWDENKLVKQERDEARAQVGELTGELESYRVALATAYRQPAAKPSAAGEPARPAPPNLASVLHALRQAQNDFAATLLFLPSALEAAAASPYQWPEKVYALFAALDELTRLWQQQGRIGAGWHQALKTKGFDYKENISPTARGKFGHEYTFAYEGQSLRFEHHVTLGAKSADTCISIHWHRDEGRKLLVIGWCGRHLANTQS